MKGYDALFIIPTSDWQDTSTVETERARARKRHNIRQYSKRVWRLLKNAGRAWPVRRYIIFIGVATPKGKPFNVVSVAEASKPVIDAGTDTKLWLDDDAKHRHSTIFYQYPASCKTGEYRLYVSVRPILQDYQIGRKTISSVEPYKQQVGAGWQGYTIRFHIPEKLWITSNFTDADLAARQKGMVKAPARKWGDGSSHGIREKLRTQLTQLAITQWKQQGWQPVNRCIIIATVEYPSRNDSDPDNTAETVDCILHAGQQLHTLPSVTSDAIHSVMFTKSGGYSASGYHNIYLTVIPIPATYHVGKDLATR